MRLWLLQLFFSGQSTETRSCSHPCFCFRCMYGYLYRCTRPDLSLEYQVSGTIHLGGALWSTPTQNTKRHVCPKVDFDF
ncbi:hypothetical protein BDV11DRAFT_184193 [Aspergillus similis]